MHAYIPNNIGLNSRNYYSWMREIHMVKTMKIIVCIRRIISGSLGKPRNLLSLEVQNVIREGKSKHVICHNDH
jgi:hypothetical protein